MDSIELSAVFPISASRMYQAWLSSARHSTFTGAHAEISPGVGGAFSAWDGYISGTTIILEPEHRIVQTWRTAEFADHEADSQLEVLLEDVAEGSRITLRHSNIPAGQGEKYRLGWEDHYFTPMREHFG